MRTIYILIFILHAVSVNAQNARLKDAMQKLLQDPQLSHAIVSLYIIDKSGNTIYDLNSKTGLTPASSLKVITAASAFEMLGSSYRFKTYLGYDGSLNNGEIKGNLIIKGGGDPTLGSWRWQSTSPEASLWKFKKFLNNNEIKRVSGQLVIDDLGFGYQPIPDTWIWQDMGNYFGAGAYGINWHENKYDLYLKPSYTGGPTTVINTEPVSLEKKITNMVMTAEKGSGDKALIFAAPYSENIFATGTVGGGVQKFKISGSIPDPPMEFGKKLLLSLNTVDIKGGLITGSGSFQSGKHLPSISTLIDSVVSPSLDTILYWFLHESINLYGEALVKAISKTKNETGSTDKGTEMIREFWKGKGISAASLKNYDGSGLSPYNRITTASMVKVLQHARLQSWFKSFYNALPEMNGIRMKSGYISGVRAYTGYITAKSGDEYTFAFIINNFDGSAGTIRQKMWSILDLLK